MIVIVCPGQGSQTPGFLEPWLAEPAFRDHLDALSDSVGIDLAVHGTRSDADTIRDTAIAQPLIVAAGLLTLKPLLADGRRGKIAGIAGHSVGEITASVGAGILSEPDAMRFVRERSTAMAAAASRLSTGMSAVIGADPGELLASLESLGLYPANFNGAGQVVVGGELPGLGKLKDSPPAGSRVIPLQVAGAFHTRYMAPAAERLRTTAASLDAHHPALKIWSNHSGEAVSDGRAFIELMVGQVANPVRWDRTMDAFVAAGVSGIIELTPAGTLVGLAKRALKGVPAVALRTPDDLATAQALIDGNV
ncbi:MAG: ACP S-malonyltransferase [Microbacteriaceae bacterium]